MRVEQGRGTTVQPRERVEPARPGRAPHRAGLRPRHVAARRPDRRPARARARDGARLRPSRLTRGRARRPRREPRADERGSYDDYERFRSFDLAFHAVIMKASGNEVGLTIVRAIHRHGGITPLLAAGAPAKPSSRPHASTAAIYEALAARDGDARRRAGSRCTSNRPGRSEESSAEASLDSR